MNKHILFRLSIVFLPPLLFTVVLCYSFSVREKFIFAALDKESAAQVLINKALLNQESRLRFVASIVNPQWFLYTLKVENNAKLAVVSDMADPPYQERESQIVIDTFDGVVVVPYGKDRRIYSNINREDILGRFSLYMFTIGRTDQSFSPNSNVKIQHSDSLGDAYLNVYLAPSSKVIIFLLSLAFWGGLIALVKSLFQFIYYGKSWWLNRLNR